LLQWRYPPLDYRDANCVRFSHLHRSLLMISMGIHSADERGYGRREDEAGQYTVDEEAQPLHAESIELEDFRGTETTSNLPFFRHNQSLPRTAGCLSIRIRDIGRKLKVFVGGRHPPRIQSINPWLPSIQAYPVEWLDQKFPLRHQKLALLASFCISWIVLVASILHLSTAAGVIQGSEQPIQYIDCTESFWRRGNGCGLNGFECHPFNGTSFAFRCAANCAQVQVLNPYPIGSQHIVYRPLVIGGPVYRGDSFICGSAIHAGIVSDVYGGCGIVSLVGQSDNFPATRQNGIESVGFDSYFPLSFEFTSNPGVECKVKDQRWLLLVISLIFTTTISLFTTSASLQFFVIFTALFAHVSLISDPPSVSPYSISVLPELFSHFVGRFLPAAFCAIVLYWTCIKRSLDGLIAQIEKTVLWVGGCWIGALSNYTFGWLPLQRLYIHDLEQQPGAKLSLAIILIIIAIIVVQQVYYFRLERRLLQYLAVYGTFLAAIIACLLLPGLELRIHHYVMALLLLPGTSLQTRSSLFYQGLLLGLFINGIARWGFDAVLQTPGDLRGDAAFNSLLPSILEPVTSLGPAISNISFSWVMPPSLLGYDGISILVNDVERHRSYFTEALPRDDHFTWARNSSSALPEYFRFGYVNAGQSLDYITAGVWNVNGSWSSMELLEEEANTK
jgi:hypothetical protein